MLLSSHSFRSALQLCLAAILPLCSAGAAEPIRLVFQNGRSVPLSAVVLQGDKFVLNVPTDGFNPGQIFPLASVDHVFGEKPAELDPAIALLLTGNPAEALKLLEPIIASQRASARIPGNFWLDAARAGLVAYAVSGNSAKCTEIGKEISDATPLQGIDPFVSLGKALLLPSSTQIADREVAFRDLTTDNLPADAAAYASFYRAEVLKGAKRDMDALEAYLAVPCLYPSGGRVLNGAAEFKAAEIIATLNERREEAVSLLKSSIVDAADTLVAAEAKKRLESIQ
ncbi:MAG TPA: hypothetical protein VF258_07085 [Luteolibacter sp.]